MSIRTLICCVASAVCLSGCIVYAPAPQDGYNNSQQVDQYCPYHGVGCRLNCKYNEQRRLDDLAHKIDQIQQAIENRKLKVQ